MQTSKYCKNILFATQKTWSALFLKNFIISQCLTVYVYTLRLSFMHIFRPHDFTHRNTNCRQVNIARAFPCLYKNHGLNNSPIFLLFLSTYENKHVTRQPRVIWWHVFRPHDFTHWNIKCRQVYIERACTRLHKNHGLQNFPWFASFPRVWVYVKMTLQSSFPTYF